MSMMTWMADVLRAAGLPVREVDGWRTRGHGDMSSVLGVLCHHTAGPATGVYPSEKVVVNGRTDLVGPLANLGLDRNGTWIAIAAGQAWHAGTGSITWCPANTGNSHLIGVEAESVGTRDDWTPAQRTNYPRGVAALLAHIGAGPSRAIGHKEWAPGRKIDPAFWDMNQFRADVARWLAPSPKGFLMALSDADQALVLEAAKSVLFGIAGVRGAGLTALAIDGITQNVAALRTEVAALHQSGGVDSAAIAKQVADAVIAAGVAGPVADELARRLAS